MNALEAERRLNEAMEKLAEIDPFETLPPVAIVRALGPDGAMGVRDFGLRVGAAIRAWRDWSETR